MRAAVFGSCQTHSCDQGTTEWASGGTLTKAQRMRGREREGERERKRERERAREREDSPLSLARAIRWALLSKRKGALHPPPSPPPLPSPRPSPPPHPPPSRPAPQGQSGAQPGRGMTRSEGAGEGRAGRRGRKTKAGGREGGGGRGGRAPPSGQREVRSGGRRRGLCPRAMGPIDGSSGSGPIRGREGQTGAMCGPWGYCARTQPFLPPPP